MNIGDLEYPEGRLQELAAELSTKMRDLSEEFVLNFECDDKSKLRSETEMRAMLFSQLAMEWGCRNGVFCAWLLTKDPSFRNTRDIEGMLEPKTQRLKAKLIEVQYEYLADLAGESE